MIRNQLCWIFLTAFLFFTSFTNAQIIFSEDFDGIPGPTAGGAGTYSFPQGWLLRNVDNRTPDAQVAYINEAWERREDFQSNVIDSVAFSTSFYSPTGVSNDWMWTPEITLPAAGNHFLKWNAKAYDPLYADGYEVRIMVSPNTPTGGSGSIGNQITNSTVLFATAAENPTWTARSVDISAFNGQTFRIAFRNNSNDKFILVIDDIIVESANDFDLAITDIEEFEYTKIPLSQSENLTLSATVKNNGNLAATNFNLKASIYDSSDVLIETINSEPIILLPPAVSITPEFPDWTPSIADAYTVIYETNSTEEDPTPEDNSLTTEIEITDEVYARDNGEIVSSLGIGAGNGGYLGQSFTIQQETYTTSATVYFNNGYTGENYQLALWNTDTNGEPTTILAETELKTYVNDDPLLDTLNFENGPILLAPGRYVLTAIEFESTLAIAQTSERFTPGTTFVDWPTNPMPGWGNNEDFGDPFSKSYFLRLNLKDSIIEPDENNILYVNKNVSGGEESGNSWENAIPELADALKWAKENESEWTDENPLQIWIADGNYNPMYSPADVNFGNPDTDERQNSFLMVNNVSLYGGFSGEESSLNQRDWNANPTILSGEIQNDGVRNNNSYHVLVTGGEIGNAVVDGLVIQDGSPFQGDTGQYQFVANGFTFQNRLGGGIRSISSDLMIRNCIFRNNGGYAGMAIQSSSGNTTVINSLFYDNSSSLYSYVIGGDSITLTNVTLSQNSSTSLIYTSQLNINNSIIWANETQIQENIIYEQINVQNSIIENYEESPDPLFVDAENGDFSLQACSPAVNSGNNSFYPDLDENSLDLAGNPRLFGTDIDMGVYEFQDEQVDYSQVSFEDLTVIYDGEEHNIEVENIPTEVSVSYEITDEDNQTTPGNSATDAGVYQIKATFSGCGEPVELTATLTIHKAEAIITAEDVQTFTYDGTVKNVVASLNHSETNLIYTPQQGYTDVGTYEIEVSAPETQNYLAVSKEVELIINNAEFEGIEFEDANFTYDGNQHSIFVSGEPAEATVTYTNNAQTNAGTYTVTALIQMDNFEDLELTATLTIDKAEAIITAEDVQTFTYDGTVKNIVASLNHSETNLIYTPQQGYTDVGIYEIEVSAPETQNYLAVSKEVTLIIEEELGTTDFSDNYSVRIAPNPVQSGSTIQVHIDFPESELNNLKIRLFSMDGKLIYNSSSNQKITNLKLPMGMTSATYILQVETGKIIKNIPFIVK